MIVFPLCLISAILVQNGLASDAVLIVGGSPPSAQLYSPSHGGAQSLSVHVPTDSCGGAYQVTNSSVLLLDNSGMGSSYLLDVCAKTITDGPSLNIARLCGASARLPNGSIMVCGGYWEEDPLASCEVLNDHNHPWSLMSAHMQSARASFSLTTLHDHTIAVGGQIGWILSSVEILRDGQWNLSEPLHSALTDHAATVTNDTVFLCGGTDGHYILNTCFWLKDEQWWSGPVMQRERKQFQMIDYGGVPYAFGGWGYGGPQGKGLQSVERHTPQQWLLSDPLKNAVWDSCATVVNISC